jgi:hypothetical protein
MMRMGSMTPPTVDARARPVTRFPPAVERVHTAGPTLCGVLADAVPYTGHTTEGRRVVVEVRGRAVVHVRVGIRRYRCETFGDIGPVIVSRAGRARISARGKFTFKAGEEAERLTVSGRVSSSRARIRGTLRVRGSIATGEACASGTLRFTVTRT